MKKLLKLLLSLFIVFALVGCKSKQEEPILNEHTQEQEVIKEETKKEEVIEETTLEKITSEDTKVISSDISNMYFWVVFYDQYDNELQREALKYGTVPEYKEWLPEGFDKWVYKKSGRDVGTFKAITGNTYFKAVCNNASHSSGGSSGSNPTPQKNEYGFYYNAKYYGSGYLGALFADVSLDIIFTDIESTSSPGSKYAFLSIPYPALSLNGVFPYSVNNNVITLQIGDVTLPSLDLTINENSIDLNLVPFSWEVTMNVVEYNINNIGSVGTNFIFLGSTVYAVNLSSSITSLDIPNGFTSISSNFLDENSSIQSVSIPSSIINIGKMAFYKCTNLSSITFPNNLQTIGDSAFEYTAISSISIPRTVNSIGEFAFYSCESLENVIFESNSSITKIARRTFSESALTSIVLPNGVSEIEEEAFTNCENLESITIPASVISLGESCFGNCSSLNSITYNGTKAQWENIVKGDYWNSYIGTTVVHCTDGDYDLS